MRTAIVAALVVALSSRAIAEPPGLVPPMETKVIGEKSEAMATGLTLAGILGSTALAYAALSDPNDDYGGGAMALLLSIPAPALGHWYTNHIGTYGMLARTGAMVLVVSGLTELEDKRSCRTEPNGFFCQHADPHSGRMELAGGLALYAVSWAYDLATTRREVRRYNKARTSFIAPIVTATSGGLAVAGTF